MRAKLQLKFTTSAALSDIQRWRQRLGLRTINRGKREKGVSEMAALLPRRESVRKRTV